MIFLIRDQNTALDIICGYRRKKNQSNEHRNTLRRFILFVWVSSSTNTEQIYVDEIYVHGWILLKVCLFSILFEVAPLESGLFIYLVFDKLTPSCQGFMPMFLTGNSILLIVAVSRTTQEVVLPPGYVS